jgi:hypothetical protein
LESCCQAKYNSRKDAIEDEMRKEASNMKKEEPEVFAENTCGRYQKFLWDLMEKPDTSIAAKVVFQTNDLNHFSHKMNSYK